MDRRPSRGVIGSARLLPWVLGPTALGVLVAGIAIAAQRNGQAVLRASRNGGNVPVYPLLGHVVVMVLVGTFAVTAAVGLVRVGARIVAGLPLLAAAAGPMAIVAAPPRLSLVSLRTGDTVRWWHLTVGSAILLVLVAWTLGAVRGSAFSRPLALPHTSPLFVLLVLTAGAGLAVVAIAPEPVSTAPTALPILAWSVLAASAAVVLMTERRPAVAMATGVLAVSAVIGFPFVYRREGMGAAVPGWEFGGTSPVVLSTLLGTIVLAVVLIGVSGRVMATRHETHTRPAADTSAVAGTVTA